MHQNTRQRNLIPSKNGQFLHEVSDQEFAEYKKKVENGRIAPELRGMCGRMGDDGPHEQTGGPYFGAREWDKDWYWCIANLDQKKWPGKHPDPNHRWNTDKKGYLKDRLNIDIDDPDYY